MLITTLTYLAYISTALFVIKLLIMLIGLDHHDTDTYFDSDASFSILSTQSVFSFFMGFSWLGKAAISEWGFSKGVALSIACLFGIFIMLTYILAMKLIFKLNSIPECNIRDCIGKTGLIYIGIPEKGMGQVEVCFGGKRQIVDAKSSTDEIIPIESLVEIVDVKEKILVVKKIM